MAFPRLNAFSYWIFVLAGIFLYASFLVGTPPDGGWFAYTPLTGTAYSAGHQPRLLGARRRLRRHLDDRRRGQLPRHDVQAARPRHDAEPPAGVRVVDARLVVHGRLLGARSSRCRGPARARPPVRHAVLRARARGAARCSTSTCSGSGATPRCTSCSSPPPGMISMIVPVFSRRALVGLRLGGRVARRDRLHQLRRVGPPHVRDGHPAARRCRSSPRSSLVIAIPSGVQFFAWIAHDVARQGRADDADAVRARVHGHLPARRDHRRDGRRSCRSTGR